MKSVFILLLFAFPFLKAQTPSQFNYQGLARNNAGKPLVNQIISIRFTIHNLTPAGGINYQESRTTKTNANGLFAVVIGSTGATNVTGSIASINWIKTNTKYLQVEIDASGGTNFADLGTTQLVSVPYSEYSGRTSNLDISLFRAVPPLSGSPNINGGQSLPVIYSPIQLSDPNYNIATGTYTIPADGNYFISFSVTISVFSNGGTCYGSINLLSNEGGLFDQNQIGKYINNTAAIQYIPFSNTYIGSFIAGQKLQIQAVNSSSDPLNSFNVSGNNLFIYKIGDK